MSTSRSWSGAVAVTLRSTSSGRTPEPSPRRHGPQTLFSAGSTQPRDSHWPLHGAARDRVVFPAQLSMKLLRAVDPKVLRMNASDTYEQILVLGCPLRGRTGLEVVGDARPDLRARCGERATDRPGAELLSVLDDERHDQRRRRPSSAVKKSRPTVESRSPGTARALLSPGLPGVRHRWSSPRSGGLHRSRYAGLSTATSPDGSRTARPRDRTIPTSSTGPVALPPSSSWPCPEAHRGTTSVPPYSSSSRGIRASSRPGAVPLAPRSPEP